MNPFALSFHGRTFFGRLLAYVATIVLSVAFWGVLAFVVSYGVVRGIEAAR